VKILVVTNMAPFVRGGAEAQATHLAKNLNATPGLRAEILRVPFKWDPAERILAEMFVARSLQLTNVDRVIALKFPAYLIPHDHKTIWLIHQFRQAYDLYDAGLSNIPDTPRGAEIRRAIREADNDCFRKANNVFPDARVLRERLLRYNGFDSEVVPLPLNDAEAFVYAGCGDYLFAGGRINSGKRQHLLVEAMAHVRSGARLIVGGPPDDEASAERLRSLVRRHSLEDRVVLDLDFLPLARLAEYVNQALACAYIPLDEDAPGYVTMEAFHASKAVVAATDSGGVLDLVRDGGTGLVVSPDPAALAQAIDRIFLDRRRTERMGAAARAHLLGLGVTWPHTIERLIS
jgi:glycosyltransferase involved in cell wall biosynthesis